MALPRTALRAPGARPGGDGRWIRRIYVVTLSLTVVFVLGRLLRRLLSPWLLEPYKAPLFWLDYREGFLRRALPGEVLSWFSAPTYGAAVAAAVLLGLVGAVSLVALTWRVRSRLAEPLTRLTVPGLILASPFALPLVVRDVGRYDVLGLAALVGIAAALHRGRTGGVVLATLLAAAATASEEFLVLYLVPVVVLGVGRLVARPAIRVAAAAAILLPSLVLAVLSALCRPSAEYLAERVAAASAAGVPPPDHVGLDSASLLRLSFSEQLHLFSQYDVAILVVLLLGAVALSSATAWLVWAALGRPYPRAAAVSAGWLVLTAAVLSVLGVDFLRWWGLALLAFVAAVAWRPSAPSSAPRDRSRWSRVLGLVLVVNALWQLAPIGPPQF